MYLRETRQKRADGSVVTHLQLAESVWNPKKKRSEVRILYNCGRAEDPKTAERLKQLAQSILKKCDPQEIVKHSEHWRLIDAWPYGALYVLEALWKRLGIAEIIAEQLRGRKLDFAVERALFAMVANRACAPCSKLYCYEQWLREEVRIEGTDTLALHHLYRAMDILEAEKEEIEQALYFRLADLLHLDVELIFYDTTSLHFEIDEIYELEAELASLKEVKGESHSKRVCQLRASRRYGRYLRLTKGGLLRIDAAKRREAEQFDGKFVVHSNDDSLTPADLALGYKQLQRVEEAWRTLKSGLRMRPVYHWAVHRIHAHVALSVLALLLERVIEQACGDTWRNIQADLDRIKLAQLLSPHSKIWQVTEATAEASKHLQSLELKNPPAILHLS
jgi:hypothetical protein